MELLKAKYKTHEVSSDILEKIQDDTSVYLNMQTATEALLRVEKKVYLKLLKNNLKQEFGSLTETIFNVPDIGLLEMEEKYYNELVELIEENVDMIHEMMNCLSKDNYLELLKLLDFIVAEYANNYKSISSKIDGLKYVKKGIGYYDGRYPNNREEVHDFFQEEIEKYRREKQLEKHK